MIDQKHVNLFKAFSEFVFALRQHIVANIKANVSGDWFDFYVTTTGATELDSYRQHVLDSKELIDFSNLINYTKNSKSFTDKLHPHSREFIQKLHSIKDLRNRLMHFQSFNDSLFGTVYADMRFCASVLKLESLNEKLIELQPPGGPGIGPPPPPLPKPSSITKGFCINLINQTQNPNLVLRASNTNFSNINSAQPVWWLNIPPKKFESDLNILLVHKRDLIWLFIPSQSLYPPTNYFETRKDNGKVDLQIGIDGQNFLKDTLHFKQFHFEPYVKAIIKLPEL